MKSPNRSLRFLLVAIALSSKIASADDPSREREAAQKAFDAGIKQTAAGDITGARISFRQAYAAWQGVPVLQNLAYTEVKTGHCVEGLQHLRDYGRLRKPDPTFLSRDLPALVSECSEKVGHLQIAVAAGTSVIMDGQPVDLSDPVDVLPGTHTLVAKLDDHRETRSVRVEAKQTVEVDFRRDEAVAAVAPPSPAPPEGGAQQASTLIARPADAPAPFWTTRREWGVAVAATGAIALAFGGGFYAQAKSNDSQFHDVSASLGSRGACAGPAPASPCASLNDTSSTQRTNAILSDILLGVGATALVGGAVLFFLPDDRPTTTGLSPSFGPGTIGLNFRQEL